ncbi:MAG: 3-dehydroquinate synthase [Lentisphaerae bacterium]|jgi:3-dehydroquinate synthase|nr:3-dehydroquinate synthase [Lentisphaerota bacterium]MBT4822917.1 3-dehydroquinate synthase [Lentisphaerota bacterium]MBT5609766.1 3-dehydroquinate synthase [Lentisphaerota bacterium]MBT7061408.1 3-dehydroquinate synthase [Lentisphaerota bacterium]MBT7845098.1 3-dehydroquinate synthase [Lentisphaerota bacterium]
MIAQNKPPHHDPAIESGTAPPCETYTQRISVPFEYPVHFGHAVFSPGNTVLVDAIDRLKECRAHRVVVYLDDGLVAARPDLIHQVTTYFHEYQDRLELCGMPNVVRGGESAKRGWEAVSEVMWTIGNLHLDRQSVVMVAGGGALLDMIGFAASLVHRGLRVVRLPSTVLAQNDAGVGVKNGMDEHGMKNFVGTFSPPFAVVNDYDLLSTLADRDWIGGVAEAFKVAIIKDAEFFSFLCRHAKELRERDAATMEHLVHHCAVLHLEHIRTGGDPFEFGSARPLDFGHWAAHRIESMTGYRIGHGQAVAIGIALDSHYAMVEKLITPFDFERIVTALGECGLPIWDKCLDERNEVGGLVIVDGIEQFREHLGGRLCITLPDGIGRRREVHHIDVGRVGDAVDCLRTLSLEEAS